MIYPKDLEYKLGFDQIKQMLRAECLSGLGINYVEKLRFSNDFELIDKLLGQTNEFKQILTRELLFPSQNYIDVNSFLQKLKIEGFYLEPQALFDIKLSLNTIKKCLDFFEDNVEFTELKKIAEQVTLDSKIVRKINDIIDDHGLIRDSASEELRLIRKAILEEESNIRKELERVLKALVKEGFTSEDSTMTIRNGRMVIPVFAEYKRKVKGFIHGESGTGQTVFIEPTQILDINNELQDLRNRERREIIRILTEFSAFLGFFLPELSKAYQFLGLIDFIRAKAKLAIKIDAHKPVLCKDAIIELEMARHPLLCISLEKMGKKIIPLSIKLDTSKRILVISGPNAGGKSVCLKTIGLLQYMLQTGLLIPCMEHSKMCIFNDLMVDIGDEQSLENDLSTYSSHLTNMKAFIERANKRSMLLIDEFGGGTEPQYGAAIAEAILEKLVESKAFGVITTHFSNLKSIAQERHGLINGAMAFDMDNLEPLFRLEIGNPGSSFALELAQKIGLPENVIQSAKEKLGKELLSLDEMLRKLESEKTKFYHKNQYVAAIERKMTSKIEHYEKLQNELQVNKNKYLAEAKLKAKELFADVNKKIETAIREIKESGAEKNQTKQLREDLKKLEEDISTPIPIEVSKDMEDDEVELTETNVPLQSGDWIKLKDNGAVGKLLTIKGKDAEISIGTLQSKVKLERLIKATRKEYRELMNIDQKSGHKHSFNINEKFAAFSPNADWRGMRSEDAIAELIIMLDNALLFGSNQLRIVHGKGDGILRKMLREHLSRCSFVKKYYDEHPDRGGAGVTIIDL